MLWVWSRQPIDKCGSLRLTHTKTSPHHIVLKDAHSLYSDTKIFYIIYSLKPMLGINYYLYIMDKFGHLQLSNQTKSNPMRTQTFLSLNQHLVLRHFYQVADSGWSFKKYITKRDQHSKQFKFNATRNKNWL